MQPSEYFEEVNRTKNGNYEKISERLSEKQMIDLVHSCMGMTTEVGEFVDTIKRKVFYGKEVDLPNLKEELGDIFWYFTLASTSLGFSLEEIMKVNSEKLRARYKKGFSETEAINRNLETERKILES